MYKYSQNISYQSIIVKYLLCFFIFIQSISEYFDINNYFKWFPFSAKDLALINNLIGLLLIISIMSYISLSKIDIKTILMEKHGLWLFIFIGYCIFNIWILNPQTPEKIFYTKRLIQFFLLYIIVIIVVDDLFTLKLVVNTLLMATILKAIVIILGTKNILQSNNQDAMEILNYMPIFLIIAFNRPNNYKIKNNLIGIFVLSLLFLSLLSGERRGLISFIFILGLFLLKVRFKFKFLIWFLLISSYIFIIRNYGSLPSIRRYHSTISVLKNRQFNIFNQSQETIRLTSGRNIIWKVYWEKGLENPIKGNGIDYIRLNLKKFDQSKRIKYNLRASNLFLAIFADLGFLGFILILIIISSPIKNYLKYANTENSKNLNDINNYAWGFFIIWINYHIQGFFGQSGPYSKEWYLIYSFCIVSIKMKTDHEKIILKKQQISTKYN